MPKCHHCSKRHAERAELCTCGHYSISDEAGDDPFHLLGTLFSNHVLVRVIEHATDLVVYEALQLGVTRPVAIQILRKADIKNQRAYERYIAAVNTLSQLKHANILSPLSIIDEQKYLGIVSPYIVSPSLALHTEENDLTSEDIVHILHQCLRVLVEAHRLDIVHANFTPEAILLSHIGADPLFVKVTRFIPSVNDFLNSTLPTKRDNIAAMGRIALSLISVNVIENDVSKIIAKEADFEDLMPIFKACLNPDYKGSIDDILALFEAQPIVPKLVATRLSNGLEDVPSPPPRFAEIAWVHQPPKSSL